MLSSAISGDNTAANTILIVDDDPINRKILGKIFSKYYNVMEAENGVIALAQILDSHNPFCAVLLDVLMPGINGIEVLQRLKDFRIAERLPIFLITAEASDAVMREAYDLGVMDVISKPVIPYVVTRRVRSVIELFEARKHLSGVVESQNLEIVRQAEQILQLNRGMIAALATIIEFRDSESGGHVQRIQGITRTILQNTDFGENLSENEINNISLASIMHDVGKICIPDAVLLKPGKLTAEEYEVMKSHTIRGVEILESVPQLEGSGIYEYALDIAAHHHERWDGRGYPHGLVGEQITPWSQVVALADVYDALSCKRVYKPPIPRQQVVDMISTGQCGLFNPHLVESFIAVEDQLYELYRELPEAQMART